MMEPVGAARSRPWLFWVLNVMAWSAYGAIEYIIFTVTPAPVLAEARTIALPSTIIDALTFFAVSSAVGVQLRRRLPSRASYRRALGESGLALALWVPLGMVVNYVATRPLARLHPQLLEHMGIDHPVGYLVQAMLGSIFAVLPMMAWTALYLGARLLRENIVERADAARNRALATDAQLQALRYQLNPHFLFNSLSALRGLIHEDPQRAEQMVCELADFLRAALVPDAERATRVPLGEELLLARTYLAIEKVRFEDSLQVAFDVAHEVEGARVPSLLLNPLVENAVRYGHRTSPSPLHLTVSAQREDTMVRLQVSNTGTLLPAGERGGSGIGLRNVRERLELLYPGRHSLELREDAGWVHATITLPCELGHEPPAPAS
jgi:signal transduction histidine kinase